MSKMNEPSFIEQYAEKIVLGVCAALLIVAALYWGLSSPRTIAIDGKEYSPGKTDEALLRYARKTYDRVARRASEVEESSGADKDSLIEQIAVVSAISFSDALKSLPLLGKTGKQHISKSVGPIGIMAKVSLADIEPIFTLSGKPTVMTAHELPYPGLDEEPVDKRVGRAVMVLPYGRWREALAERLAASSASRSIVIYEVQWQRIARRPDGTWTQPQLVHSAGLPVIVKDEKLTKPKISDPLDALTDAQTLWVIESIGGSPWRRYILQPDYPNIYVVGWNWMDWRIHLPENKLSQKMIDAGWTPDSERDRDRLWRPGTDRPGPMTGPLTRPLTRPLTDPDGGRTDRDRTGGYGSRRPLQVKSDPDDEKEPAPVPTPVPAIAKQFADGEVLAWVHDDSLESGREYRYRVCVKVVNPLYLKHKSVVDDQVDSRSKFITCPWSQWSDPVAVGHLTELFLTGSRAPNPAAKIRGQMRMTVFTRTLGQYVAKDFMVEPGQSIGGLAKVKVTNPVDRKVMDVNASFTTDAVAVAIKFRHSIIKNGRPRDTVSILYLDGDGVLRTRIKAIDEDAPRYKRLRRLGERTRSAVLKAARVRSSSRPL